MSTEPGLDIAIKVTADTAGAKQAEQALSGLASSVNKAGQTTKEFGKEAAKGFQESGKSAREAREVMQGLSEASEGGVRGFIGLTSAAKGFFGLMRGAVAGNPLGLLLVGVSAAVGLFAALKSKTSEAGEAAKKTGTEFESASTAAKKLATTDFESLSRKLSEIQKNAATLLSTLAQANALLDKRDEAEAAAKTAKIDANPLLSDVEKTKQKAQVAAGVVAGKRSREDEALQREVDVKGKTLVALDDALTTAKRERVELEKRVTQAIEKQKARTEEIATLEVEEEQLKKRRSPVSSDSDQQVIAEQYALAKKLKTIGERLENLRGAEALAQSPESKDLFDRQKTILETKKAAEKDVRSRAEAAADDFQKATITQQLARSVNPAIRKAEDAKFAVETNQALKTAAGTAGLKDQLSKGLEEEAKLKATADSDHGFTLGGSAAEKALAAKRASNQALRDKIAGSPTSTEVKAGKSENAKTDADLLKSVLEQLPGRIGAAVAEAVSKGGSIEKGGEKFSSKDGTLTKIADATGAAASAATSQGEAIVENVEKTSKEMRKTTERLKNLRPGT